MNLIKRADTPINIQDKKKWAKIPTKPEKRLNAKKSGENGLKMSTKTNVVQNVKHKPQVIAVPKKNGNFLFILSASSGFFFRVLLHKMATLATIKTL